MIPVTPHISLDEAELHFEYVQATGPGGQNVNKVATAVQLRFALDSPSLPEEVRQRLRRLAGRQLVADDTLLIHARRFRTQAQNRQDAVQRLLALIRQAAIPPRPRHPTRPTRASQEQRLQRKRRRGEVKHLRRTRGTLDES